MIKGEDNFKQVWKWATTGDRTGAEEWLPEIDKTETWDPSYKPDGLWLGEYMKRTNYRRHRLWEKTPEWWESLCDTYDDEIKETECSNCSEYYEWSCAPDLEFGQ